MKRSLILFAVLLVYSSAAYSSEIPADTLAKVRASIESRYPDNYSMQKALIDDQVESYNFLEIYTPRNVPADLF